LPHHACHLLEGEDNKGIVTHRQSYASTSDWWDAIIAGKPRNNMRCISGRFLYVLLNAWKERNQRIFTGRRLTYLEVASIVREDIMQMDLAFAIVVCRTFLPS
jgi:hypothetical protein